MFFFLALAPRSGLEAASSHAVARSSVVFCYSISRYRAVMAASRLLGAAAACVRLLSFAAGPRKSYWSCCIKAAIVICQQIFAFFGTGDFPFKIVFKSSKCFKIVFFFALAPAPFGAAISIAIMYWKVSLCKNIFV